jgi:ABC-type molybdate transport system substrate-binding protein
MKRASNSLAVAILFVAMGAAVAADFPLPWNTPPEGGKNFTVEDIDNVPDLYGDINDPQLVLFLSGNQYMVVPDLVRAFQAVYPKYQRIFIETLPPGILADQIEQGALVVGNMRVTLKPDIYATGKGRMEQFQRDRKWFSSLTDYARNRLAIMTYRDNPDHIAGWTDLARADVPICMPNPKWEGIAENQIIPALRATGGEELVSRIYAQKVEDGTNFLTQIHHRQTPVRIMQGKCTAGAVWYSEAYYHAALTQHPLSVVAIPDAQNRYATFTAGLMRDAPHPEAGEDFLRFLRGPEAQTIYRMYGFLPPASE